MFVLLHIWKKSHDVKKKIPDIKCTLKDALNMSFLGDVKVFFTVLFTGFSGKPNAMSLLRGIIIVNAEWAARLVLFDDEEVKRAFRFTMGHEMTHQSGDYTFLEAFTKDRRFVNWVNEVHADYGGAQLAFDGNINNALLSVRYKKQDFQVDKDSQTHPSWRHREGYLKAGVFDMDLIKRIAGDAGCDNKALIDKVCNYFVPIKLRYE